MQITARACAVQGFDSNPADRRSALLVEDEPLIAFDAEALLLEIGVKSVRTAFSANEALRLVLESPPDMAILDVNLGGGTSMMVADELERLKIPFVFATGYGDSAFLPDLMKSVPIVRKPLSADALRVAIGMAFGRRA